MVIAAINNAVAKWQWPIASIPLQIQDKKTVHMP